MNYEQMVEILKNKLTKEEFLNLQELMDGDSDHSLLELISQEAEKMAPELFNKTQSLPGRLFKSVK